MMNRYFQEKQRRESFVCLIFFYLKIQNSINNVSPRRTLIIKLNHQSQYQNLDQEGCDAQHLDPPQEDSQYSDSYPEQYQQ